MVGTKTKILTYLEMLYAGDTPSIHAMLSVLEQTGMGYITPGQPTNTLSGGVAQRVKLAKEIGRRCSGFVINEQQRITLQKGMQ